jgi:NADPH:quinone reductase-like Zn-dependent oxidoreductase
MAGKTHLALLQEEPKGPLIVRSVPTVSPGKGQIQIKVKAASLNV